KSKIPGAGPGFSISRLLRPNRALSAENSIKQPLILHVHPEPHGMEFGALAPRERVTGDQERVIVIAEIDVQILRLHADVRRNLVQKAAAGGIDIRRVSTNRAGARGSVRKEQLCPHFAVGETASGKEHCGRRERIAQAGPEGSEPIDVGAYESVLGFARNIE